MKKILSVDDERSMLQCIKAALSTSGYEVFTTTDADQAFQILESEDIDLVILDIRMPGISGFDIYRKLKQERTTPVLFATAYPKSFNLSADPIMRMWQEDFADGMTDIIYKPFDLSALDEKVAGLIGPAHEE